MWSDCYWASYSGALRNAEESIARQQRSFGSMAISTTQRIRDLENDLARITLLARALADLCVQKGILTPQELATAVKSADLADGVEDGKVTRAPKRPYLRRR